MEQPAQGNLSTVLELSPPSDSTQKYRLAIDKKTTLTTKAEGRELQANQLRQSQHISTYDMESGYT